MMISSTSWRSARFKSGTYLLSTWILALWIITYIPKATKGYQPKPKDHGLVHSYHEAILAGGGRIPLSTSGIYEIELVPNISDTIAFRLDRDRWAIKKLGIFLSPSQRWRAYEIVYGVGEKKARELYRYIDPSE